MSGDYRVAPYRERARLFGRRMLFIAVAPAVFFAWNSIGLPGIPGVDFGNGGAQADPGLVVRISGIRDTSGSATPFRDRASAAAATARRRPGTQNAAHAFVSPAHPRIPAIESMQSPDGTPDPARQISPRVPSVTPHTEPATAAPPQVTVPSVELPAVPPTLPTVTTPAPVLPPLPLTPALPAVAPVSGIAAP